jgi:hypothetical protein
MRRREFFGKFIGHHLIFVVDLFEPLKALEKVPEIVIKYLN